MTTCYVLPYNCPVSSATSTYVRLIDIVIAETWKDVAGILQFEYSSPAAVRLALSLLFGAHVMRPQLLGHGVPSVQ